MATTLNTIRRGELRLYPSAEEVAHAAAELFVQTCEVALRERGRFTVSLSGGSSPKRTYELLASAEFSKRIDWNRVHLFWGDERYVSHDDPSSNFRMTWEALLRHVKIPAGNVHAVRTEISPAEAAAEAYEDEIRTVLGSVAAFDLIYLGLGTNGHTASLFPYSPVLKENSRLVGADFVKEVNSWRITMTAPLLSRGRCVAFVIAGRDKAHVVREVLTGPQEAQRLPAQLIDPGGELLWLTDEAAASELPQSAHDVSTKQERAS